MYHIVAAQRQRQYGPPLWKNQSPPLLAAADAPGLIELSAAILAGVGGVDQELNLASPGSDVDLLAPGDEVTGARLQPEPVERCLAKRLLDPIAEIGRSGDVIGLEGAGEGTAQLSLRLSRLESRPIDADPGAAAGGTGAHIGRHLPVRPEGQADQIVPGGMRAAQDAFTLGRMRFAL